MIKPMRSKEEQEKKRKRNRIITGGVLIFVMLASTLGYAIQSTLGNNDATNQGQTTMDYNGFQFSYVNGFWIIGSFAFKNNPEEVPNLNPMLKPAEEYRGQVVYIQSQNGEAGVEVGANLRQIAQRVQEACLSKENCPEDTPIKTCNDRFIIIKESQESSIRQDNNCVYIEGKAEDLVKLSDQFLYKILGVK